MSIRQALQPVNVSTLRDYANGRYAVHAYCSACGHSGRLDLAALGMRIGWDVELRSISRGLRCSECGSRETSIRISHDGGKSV